MSEYPDPTVADAGPEEPLSAAVPPIQRPGADPVSLERRPRRRAATTTRGRPGRAPVSVKVSRPKPGDPEPAPSGRPGTEPVSAAADQAAVHLEADGAADGIATAGDRAADADDATPAADHAALAMAPDQGRVSDGTVHDDIAPPPDGLVEGSKDMDREGVVPNGLGPHPEPREPTVAQTPMAEPVEALFRGDGLRQAQPTISAVEPSGPSELSTITRGRRRAASRHRTSRSVRLPTPLALFLHYGLPTVVLLVLYAVAVVQFSYAPATTGPLPPSIVLLSTLATIALTYLVARRVGLSSLGAAVAAALVTIAPAAIDSNAAGVPEHLAIVALLGSVALITVRRQQILTVPGAALLAGLAAVISPYALIAVPFLAIRARTGWRRRRGRRPVLMGAVVFLATLGVGAVFAGAIPFPPLRPELGTTTLQEWLARDPIGTVVAVAAVGIGFTNRRLRLFSAVAVLLLVLSVWPDGDVAVRYSVLLSPTFAVLIGGFADLAVEAIGRHAALPRLAGIVGTAALALAIVVAVTLSSIEVRSRAFAEGTPGTPGTPATSPSPSVSAAPTPPRPTADTSAAAVAERTAMGIQLLRNPRLSVSEVARRLLADGSVDSRISIVLGQILSEHTLTVADFPVVGGDDPSVRRQLLATEMDGAVLATGGASMSSLTAYLSGLVGTFAVESVAVNGSGVLATFGLSSPTPSPTPIPSATSNVG